MNHNRLFGDEVKSEIFKLIFIILFFYIFKGNYYSQEDLFNKSREMCVIIGGSIIYFLCFNIFRLFQKPIEIKIFLSNFTTHDNQTIIYKTGVVREDVRKIIATINIKETNSAWNWFALKLLKKHLLKILICTEPENNGLVCQPTIVTDNIKIKDSGFTIELNGLLKSNLEKGIPFEKKYEFIINENRDAVLLCDDEFPIKPTILDKDKPLSYVIKLFFKFEITSEKKYHVIKIIY